ncbi:MAG: biopolymer transporter ExbD [Rikenellaceae bacterium]
MAIKRSSKVETSFGASAMTDMMFLLLMFFLVLTTLINTNALDIMLPKSSNKVTDKATLTMAVTNDLKYFVEGKEVTFEMVEPTLKEKLAGVEKPLIMLSIDKRVSVDEFAKIMNIARANNFALYMVTTQ